MDLNLEYKSYVSSAGIPKRNPYWDLNPFGLRKGSIDPNLIFTEVSSGKNSKTVLKMMWSKRTTPSPLNKHGGEFR